MGQPDRAQIYVVTPPVIDLTTFPDRLAGVLDRSPVACLRLDLATHDADRVARAADALRSIAHDRDIPLVVARHAGLVASLGLDGVHLDDGPRHVRHTRAALGADAVVGAFCGASQHDGMTAGEMGADYVAFGPVGDTGVGAKRALPDLFDWWSGLVELPVVAEGALDLATIRALAPHVDFFAVREEIWDDPDPAEALVRLVTALG